MSRLYKWAAVPLLALAIAIPGYFWLTASSGSGITAQIAVTGACEDLQRVSSYDATTYFTMTSNIVPGVKTATEKKRVSGLDSHSASTYDFGVESGTWEYIRVNGVVYESEDGEEWRILKGSFNDPFPIQADEGFCLNLTEFGALGEDRTLDGLLADHYSAGSTLIGPTGRVSEDSVEPGSFAQTAELYEFWIDSDGQLVQMKESQTHVGVNLKEEKIIDKVEYVTVFSGIGDPNIITAPATSTIVQ